MLSDNIYDYYNVSQGKVTVPNMDDGEEFQLADVSAFSQTNQRLYTPHIHTQTNINFPFHKEDKTLSSLSRGNFQKFPYRISEQQNKYPIYLFIQTYKYQTPYIIQNLCVFSLSLSLLLAAPKPLPTGDPYRQCVWMGLRHVLRCYFLCVFFFNLYLFIS